MHAGKSVFILCGKHYILPITRHFISLQRGKNHSHKLRWSSFLMSKLTNLPLIPAGDFFTVCRAGQRRLHHPLDGLSDCARSSVLWATSAHLSLPGLNDVPGTLQTVEKEFFTKLGLIRSARFARAPIKTSPLTKRAVERRTLPRKLELFKARTGSPRKKNWKSFVTRLKMYK